MQLAHPLVAAGVADHSDFREYPLRRLRNTLNLTLGLVFGTRGEALRAARRINTIHQAVNGSLAEDAGPLSRGTPYSATDPELLLWVHATLVYTAVVTYETFVRPLGETEREGYYQETRQIAKLLGIPKDRFAADWTAFQDYLELMIDGGPVVASACSRDLARSVLRPALPLVPAVLYAPYKLVTTGLLPRQLRAAYGLPWGASQRRAFRLLAILVPRIIAKAPNLLRTVPPARTALRRRVA